MAGPFDIDQVNIPALLGLHSQIKQQSLENMYRAEQIAHQRRENQRAEERRALIGKVFSGNRPASPAPTAPAAPAAPADDLDQFMPGSEPGTLASGQAAPVAGPVAQAPTDLIDPAQLPARTDGLTINQDALRELYAFDAPAAMEIQKAVFDMDKATADRITERGKAMASIAGGLKGLPQEQRAAAFRNEVPRLLALGFAPEKLSQTDLSDAGLNRYYRAGLSMEQLVAIEKDTRDFGLRERQFDETSRHNRASEGISGGNLALARQRESRVRQWGPQAIIIGGAGAPRTDTSDLDY